MHSYTTWLRQQAVIIIETFFFLPKNLGDVALCLAQMQIRTPRNTLLSARARIEIGTLFDQDIFWAKPLVRHN